MAELGGDVFFGFRGGEVVQAEAAGGVGGDVVGEDVRLDGEDGVRVFDASVVGGLVVDCGYQVV